MDIKVPTNTTIKYDLNYKIETIVTVLKMSNGSVSVIVVPGKMDINYLPSPSGSWQKMKNGTYSAVVKEGDNYQRLLNFLEKDVERKGKIFMNSSGTIVETVYKRVSHVYDNKNMH